MRASLPLLTSIAHKATLLPDREDGTPDMTTNVTARSMTRRTPSSQRDSEGGAADDWAAFSVKPDNGFHQQ